MITLQRKEVIPLLGEPVPPTAGGRRGGLFPLATDFYQIITTPMLPK
jgi:hypothetical protein